MSYTVGRDDWWRLRYGISSRRYTSTSSRPGATIVGTVHHARLQLVPCSKCGGQRYDFPGPHAPHFNAALQRVNCVGEVISEALDAR